MLKSIDGFSKLLKVCTKCKVSKANMQFGKCKREKSGLRPQCKSCVKEYRSRPESKIKRIEQYSNDKNSYLEYYSKNKEKILKRQKEYHSSLTLEVKNKEKYRMKKIRDDLKSQVFTEYSKRLINSDIPCCICCGENEHISFLTIDHIDGRKHLSKEERNLTGHKLYRWLRKNNYPQGYSVLCMNCNFAKGSLGKCPHQLDKMKK